MKNQGLGKPERLCSIKTIASLFEKGHSFNVRLLNVIWAVSPSELPFPAQVAFSVPKRKFRHAVTRNLIKRRLREAYRKRKASLYESLVSHNMQIVFILVFRGSYPAEYREIEAAIEDALTRLSSAVKETAGKC